MDAPHDVYKDEGPLLHTSLSLPRDFICTILHDSSTSTIMPDSVAQPFAREQREYVMSASDSVVPQIRDADPHEARQTNGGIYAIVAKNRVNILEAGKLNLELHCCVVDTIRRMQFI